MKGKRTGKVKLSLQEENKVVALCKQGVLRNEIMREIGLDPHFDFDRLVFYDAFNKHRDEIDKYQEQQTAKNAEEAKFIYAIRMSGMVTGQPGFASQCVQCGECLEKCPQELNIPDLLENVVDDLEDGDLEKRVAMGKKYLGLE